VINTNEEVADNSQLQLARLAALLDLGSLRRMGSRRLAPSAPLSHADHDVIIGALHVICIFIFLFFYFLEFFYLIICSILCYSR
jgi:hypothetical protein